MANPSPRSLRPTGPNPGGWKAALRIDLRRFNVVVLVLVAYVLAIVPLYSGIGDAVFFLSLLPLVITASLIGTWPAVIVAVILSALNLYLSFALNGGTDAFWGKGAVFTLLHLLIGAGVGRWRDLNLRLQGELTQRKEMESRLEQLAYFDLLTGLPNRLLFHDRLEVEMAHARREKSGLNVLFLNLDQLKSVNDGLGHDAGDRLLAEAGNRIRRSLRNSDTVARFGSDTFAILLPRVRDPAEEVAAVAEKVLSSLRHIFFVAGQELHITARIGMAAFPRDGEEPETLLRNADAALNQAKAMSTQTFHAYNPAINKMAVERMALENGIRKALGQEELSIHYQPIVETSTGAIVAAEALLRWKHPELGAVTPDVFIPVAEDTGMIHVIGDWVLRMACKQLRVWQALGHPDMRVAVNISPRQLKRPRLWEDFAAAARDAGVKPECVDLEITESSLLGQESQVIENMEKLRGSGFHLALDDFGTGYSCLGYLKRLPLSCLKVDRSFIREVNTDPEYASITYAIVAMAKALKLKVIAEGVETQEQCSFLWQVQCDEIQGFLFNKPMPPDELTAILADINQRRTRFIATQPHMVESD